MVKAMKIAKSSAMKKVSAVSVKKSAGLMKHAPSTSASSMKKDADKVSKRPASKSSAHNEDDDEVKSQISAALSKTPSLDEKLQLLRNSDLSTAENVRLLNEKLSHPEWNKLHGRFRTARANDEELEETAPQTPKNLMRALTSAWILDPSKGEVYRSMACSVSAKHTMTKILQWESEKSILSKWTQEELDRHINSGRIVYREDPCTPGAWEYKDTKNIQESQTLEKDKRRTYNQSAEMAEEEFDAEMVGLEDVWNHSNVESYQLYSLKDNPEGKGSGKGAPKNGKGNGKGTGKGKIPALEDDPKKKLKSVKASLSSTIKTLGSWGFSQSKMQPKQKKALATAIKKLEAQLDSANGLTEGSTDEINTFVSTTNKMISESKQMME